MDLGEYWLVGVAWVADDFDRSLVPIVDNNGAEVAIFTNAIDDNLGFKEGRN